MRHRRNITMKRSGAAQPKVGWRVQAILWGAVFLLLGLGGCGVKGPPVPPRQPVPPAVTDLAFQVADGSVTLTWRLTQPLSGKPAGPWAFGIYRARSVLDQPACDTCPLVFEKVGTVPYVEPQVDRFSTAIPLDAGYRYVFKVRLEKNRRAGPDSQPIRFDYPPPDPAGHSETP